MWTRPLVIRQERYPPTPFGLALDRSPSIALMHIGMGYLCPTQSWTAVGHAQGGRCERPLERPQGRRRGGDDGALSVTLLLAFALPALRHQQAGRSRRLELVGLVLTMIGADTSVLLCDFFSVVKNFFAVDPLVASVFRISVVVLLGGVVILLAGLFIFGIAIARANVQPRWAAPILALGIPLSIAATAILYLFSETQAVAQAPWGGMRGGWGASGVIVSFVCTGVGLTTSHFKNDRYLLRQCP
jgi:hypothetical protein